MSTYIIKFFITICIAGFIANLFHFLGKVAIWIGLVIAKKSTRVNFTFNIVTGYILSLFIATYFLFLA